MRDSPWEFRIFPAFGAHTLDDGILPFRSDVSIATVGDKCQRAHLIKSTAEDSKFDEQGTTSHGFVSFYSTAFHRWQFRLAKLKTCDALAIPAK